MKILLIVEDTVTRGLLKGIFAQRGHDVETCRDSESGWEAFNRESHSMVVLQADLAGKDGLHFCRCLRAHPQGREVVVILLTPPGQLRDPSAMVEAGVDDTIATPVDVEQVELRLGLVEGRMERWRACLAASDERTHATGELQDVLDSSLVAVCFTNADGRVVAANDFFLHLAGAERSELGLGTLTWRSMLDEGQFPAFERNLKRAIGAPAGHPIELELVRRDHVRVPMLMRVAPNRDGAGHVATIVDLTGLKRQHQMDRRVEKMEAMGQLARGIEQHFNNLLTTVTGYSEILLADLDPLDLRHDYLSEIRRAADQAAAVTRQLLVFSHGQVLAPRALDLNAVLSRVEKVLRRLLGKSIELRLVLASDLGRVRADLVQVEKMIVNLAANARDAMPDGGSLCIETSQVDVDDDTGPGHLEAGPYVRLTVTDTGHGMDPETAARVFEPFFTTRPVGRNMGLGLAVVFGVVQQSGGHVEVASTPGEGTRFSVYLPLAVDQGEALAEESGGPALPRGLETVLLVDPESSVRVFARMVLSRCGYHVLEASNVNRAWRHYQEEAGAIHLLVMSLGLPGGDGVELVERVLSLKRDANVLYLLSSRDDAEKRRVVLETPVATLEKPFTPAALARKVRQVLDSGT